MILGPDGKPVRGSITMMMTPEWLVRELTAQSVSDAAKMRILELRESVGAQLSVEGPQIGSTIHIRKPPRYSR
jgi:hypothetical protein